MAGDVQPYIDLVTSEHRERPKFAATIAALCQPIADATQIMRRLYYDFDLDNAVGVQLDIDGLWIGRTRAVEVAIADVYFSFDIPGLGFDQGVWFTTGSNPTSSLVFLPDYQYRLLLKATAAENRWDGSVGMAYEVWNIMFGGSGITLQIHDNQDMTMDIDVNLNGATPDALTLALINAGYLNLRPSGVSMTITVNP